MAKCLALKLKLNKQLFFFFLKKKKKKGWNLWLSSKRIKQLNRPNRGNKKNEEENAQMGGLHKSSRNRHPYETSTSQYYQAL